LLLLIRDCLITKNNKGWTLEIKINSTWQLNGNEQLNLIFAQRKVKIFSIGTPNVIP
jgi:hypothetical protein